ncbi:hypothetical protein [Haloarcula brevis]|uniref:hypothetical protein n=1 Tax=Haloarcula brevis TaxID=3111453 RepID=UPI00300EE6BA
MSTGRESRERPRRTAATALGAVGVAAATAGLALDGPTWLGLAGVALGGLFLFGTPVLAVVFGQIALVAVDAPSLLALLLVEGGLLVVLLAGAVGTPDGRAAGGLAALVVPLLGGLCWLSVGRWTLDPLPVGTAMVTGVAVVGYLLHRYLLIDLGVVTDEQVTESENT